MALWYNLKSDIDTSSDAFFCSGLLSGSFVFPNEVQDWFFYFYEK
jgi:hypothetical protein